MERPRFDIVASGERMREIRRQRNISVKQVMEYMGFESTQAVYKWEAGKCYPQADNLVDVYKRQGDIVVSQDYGVAAMALGKGAYAIHQSGKWYTDENIDQMLMERNLNKKARRGSHKNHIKGPRKRTEEDDVRFAQSFEKMIQTIIQIR